MKRESSRAERDEPLSATTEFVIRLRDAVSARGITNKDLAAAIGTDQGTVSRWLNGKQKPGEPRLEVLERALNLPTGRLSSRQPDLQGSNTLSIGPAGGTLALEPRLRLEDEVDTANIVMLEFNRWLEPYVSACTPISPVDAAAWMQRMWQAALANGQQTGQAEGAAWPDPDQLLDIEIEPGTGVAITSHQGRVVMVNTAMMDMLRMAREELVGKYVWELNAPEYRARGRRRIRQQGTEPWDMELMASTGDRVPVTISNVRCHLNGSPVRVALVKQRSGDGAGE